MSSPTLLQNLLASLLENPIVDTLAGQAKDKAISILLEHFTFTGQEISKGFAESYGYALTAIRVGVAMPEQKFTWTQKIRHSKITREFAEQIEQHYFQPFVQKGPLPKEAGVQSFSFENGVQSFSFVREQILDELKQLAQTKATLFEVQQIQEADLVALLNYQGTFAITDLVLEQIQAQTELEEMVASFLRYEDLLGHAILFFFRELLRKDDRLAKTQAALQREGLCVDVQNLQIEIQTAQANLNQAIVDQSTNLVDIAQQLQTLQQTQMAWQTRQEPLLQFTQRFDMVTANLLDWAKSIDLALEEIGKEVKETKEEVKITQDLAAEILDKLNLLMAQLGLSSQIKMRDEFTQHNQGSLEIIQWAVTQVQQLSPQHPDYAKVSVRLGSALSSTGDLARAERTFQQLIDNAKNENDRALAHFNLFQVQLRGNAYDKALANLQAAIDLNSQRYALHDFRKYPLAQLLGAGGMGCVFLCQNDNRLLEQKRVVVKCFWENLKGSLEKVFKEPFAMRDIAGDYIPKPLDFGYADNFNQERAFFVTEYIDEAIDGEAWLEKYGPLDLDTGLAVGLQIAQGLQIAHDAGIYHLDLKPANILLYPGPHPNPLPKGEGIGPHPNPLPKGEGTAPKVKIIDFGLSQVATSLQEKAVQQSHTGLSSFGQAIFGTLDYAPPEQRGFSQYGKPSAKSDIFAFGKTLYKLLTGQNPHTFHPRQLKKSPELFELLCDCVEQEPKLRPKSAQQLVSYFEESQEIKKQAKIAQQKAEAEKQRQAEIARQKAEAEKQRQAEEAEKQRQAEMARQKAEAEKQRQAEEAEKQRQAEMARQKAEAEKQRQAEEAEKQRQVEMARQKAEAEKQRQAEEAEKQRQAKMARQKAEAEKQRQAEEAEKQRQAEMARQKAEAEKQRKLKEEKERQAKIAQQKAEEEKRRQAEKAKQQKTFVFEIVTVNRKGEITHREQKSARYETENLGNGVTLDMVQIPSGTFMMGSPENEKERSSAEGPQHRVTVDAFWMGKYPITQAQWQAIMGNNPARYKGDNRPVENVTWHDAVEFCQKLSEKAGKEYRLPSEAEWEYACRAGTTTPFYFGDTITPDLANYDGNYTYADGPKGVYRNETTDVGSFPPNAFGLYDMHGNVWEWCADLWHDSYNGAPTDGSAWLEEKSKKWTLANLFAKKEAESRRLLRGGSFVHDPVNCRSANRHWNSSVFRSSHRGFRVVSVAWTF
jgi:formylglycine-generating enzyme required for sulfatase activity/tetratricopeptide (TPR) repeat protein